MSRGRRSGGSGTSGCRTGGTPPLAQGFEHARAVTGSLWDPALSPMGPSTASWVHPLRVLGSLIGYVHIFDCDDVVVIFIRVDQYFMSPYIVCLRFCV